MNITLKRIARKPTYTIGKFYIDGEYTCDTIEDTDRNLSDDMSELEISKIKVYSKTAIPTGTYTISYTYSNRFKCYLPLLNNVKGFSGIRIHSGNTEKDTSGCIILGENKIVGKVINSKKTCDKIIPMIKNACKNKEKVIITIK